MRAQLLAENLETYIGGFQIVLSDHKASSASTMSAGPRGWIAKVSPNYQFYNKIDSYWVQGWVHSSDICPNPAAAIKSLFNRIMYDHPKNSIFKGKTFYFKASNDGLFVRLPEEEYISLENQGII